MDLDNRATPFDENHHNGTANDGTTTVISTIVLSREPIEVVVALLQVSLMWRFKEFNI